MSKLEYSDLLFEISRKLDANELQRLIFMTRELRAKGSAENIRDVLALFEELEKQNHLGIDRLNTLKEILTRTKKRSLLKKVEDFEIRRKAQSVGIISSLKRAAGSLIGAVKLKCNFHTLAGGLVVVGCGLVLRSWSSLEEYSDAFNKVVLPAVMKLVEMGESSLWFTVQAETPSALNELWSIYKNGTLKHRLQQFLVTEEIKQFASGEDVELTVYVDEQEYREAYLDLMLQQNQESGTKVEGPGVKRRRNSDSFIFLEPKENEATLMKLRHAESKLKLEREERKMLKKENVAPKPETAEAEAEGESLSWRQESSQTIPTTGEGKYFSLTQEQETQEGPVVKRFRPAATSDWQIGEFKAREIEDPEKSRKRRGRNSDSDLYCKARDEDNREREKKQEMFLGEEKYAFVQRYLEEAHETHSVVTSTSDSGHVTHGAASELGLEDISDDTPKLCIKHLSEEVTSELEVRLDDDKDAKRRVYQAFGITDPSRLPLKFDNTSRTSIFRLFPDTPVKLLNDVFEALQLYDLLELLEKQTKPRTARSLRPALTFDEITKLRNSVDRPTTYHSCAAVLIFADDEVDYDAIRIKTFFTDLDTKSDVTIIQCRILLTRRREHEDMAAAAMTVIERWIQHQDDFSFFAVFDFFSPWSWFLNSQSVVIDCFSKLASGIPKKTKLGACRHDTLAKFPETLLVTGPLYNPRLLLEILNKHWQTLDLISMIAEFKRSVKVKEGLSVIIMDSLSSLPKFKRKVYLSLSH